MSEVGKVNPSIMITVSMDAYVEQQFLHGKSFKQWHEKQNWIVY